MRKFFAIFFLSLIAIPSLVFSIFTIGITKGLTNFKLIDGILTKTIQSTPNILDEFKASIPQLEESEKQNLFGEYAFLADNFSQSNVSFQEIFKKTKLNSHLILIKDKTIKHLESQNKNDLVIETSLLKSSLKDPVIQTSIIETLKSFPKCNNQQKLFYSQQILNNNSFNLGNNVDELCYIDNDQINTRISQEMQNRLINLIPNSIVLLNSDQLIIFYNNQKKAKLFVYFVLLIPIILFTIGGFLFSENKKMIIRFIGVGIFIGALLTIALNKLFINLLTKIPFFVNGVSNNQLMIVQQVRNNMLELTTALINPIFRISLTIMITSIILFILSFFIKQSDENQIT